MNHANMEQNLIRAPTQSRHVLNVALGEARGKEKEALCNDLI